MKVVIFTNAYEPIVSGVVTAIRFFRQGLIDLGHEVYIFAPDHKDIQDRQKESGRRDLSLFRSEPYQTIVFSDCRALLSRSHLTTTAN